MERSGKWMIRRYVSGKVVELSKFWVPEQTKPRSKRKASSTPRKRDQNEREAVKRLARWINANFSHGDIWVTLTYSAEGMERIAEKAGSDMDALWEAANHQGKLFLRRMRRAMGKGTEFRSILITSDIDGKTGERVRLHHHIIMPTAAFELWDEKWGRGTVDYQILRDQDDYTPLAVYLLKQVRRLPDAKKYTPSRNLKPPAVEERISRKPGELRAPTGAKLLASGNYDSAVGNHYIRYVMPEKKNGRKDFPDTATGARAGARSSKGGGKRGSA